MFNIIKEGVIFDFNIYGDSIGKIDLSSHFVTYTDNAFVNDTFSVDSKNNKQDTQSIIRNSVINKYRENIWKNISI